MSDKDYNSIYLLLRNGFEMDQRHGNRLLASSSVAYESGGLETKNLEDNFFVMSYFWIFILQL